MIKCNASRLLIARILIYLSLALLTTTTAASRQYAVIHYQQSNGFPGSYGYNIYQDHFGYLWISTENGLSRFNGYEFKLFTTKDGLPDNEVFDMKEDSRYRLWFTPFASTLGYIKNEKVYDLRNDSLLSKLHFKTKPDGMLFDRYDNLLIFTGTVVNCITRDGRLKRFDFSINNKGGRGMCAYKADSGKLHIIYLSTIYQYDNNRFKRIMTFDRNDLKFGTQFFPGCLSIMNIDDAKAFVAKAVQLHTSFYSDREELNRVNGIVSISKDQLAVCRKDGCFLVDKNTAKITDTLLFKHNVSSMQSTTDGSLWLLTHGNGVFRFLRSPVQSLDLPNIPASVFYVGGQKGTVYAVLEKGHCIIADSGQSNMLVAREPEYINGSTSYDIYTYLGRNNRGEWICCAADIRRYKKLGENATDFIPSGYTKDVFDEDSTHLLVGTNQGLYRINKDLLKLTDTLIKERVTSVVKTGQVIYAGTLDGLLAGTAPSQFRRVFTSTPELNSHIVKLCADMNGVLWAANNKGELIVVKNYNVLAVINNKTGLQCNRISAIGASQKLIWVGTDNGLYGIRNTFPYTVTRHLTYETGLNSNQVNSLYIQDGKVRIGTTNGINYFNEEDVLQQLSQSKLIINSITNGTNAIAADTGIIKVSQKALAIDFDIIDFAGGQKPLFQYRLNNDSDWVSIENSNLYFPSIPYGDFAITIQAFSPNWKNGSLRALHFYHPYPFYFHWWFIVLVSLIVISITSGGIVLFIRRVRKKDHEKLSVQRSLLQLEQMALQGQMNPHFIFNCITAIKHYYNSGHKEKANDFVDAFSSMIRQTFEMGTEAFVSLDKELNYLAQYLSLEQKRFDHSFSFSITKDLSLPETAIPVPAMLLQPIAENAVRHGIRHLSDRRGIINISVTQKENIVAIVITDNGIGRQKSRSYGLMYQQVAHITSTTVNAKRIDILNKLFEYQIVHITEDVTDEQNEITGTRVYISYPLTIRDLQY